MCIKNLKEFKEGQPIPEYGYKVMDVDHVRWDTFELKYVYPTNPDEMTFSSMFYGNGRRYVLGQEYESYSGMGFNCFFTESAARKYSTHSKSRRLVKVKVSGVTKYGMQEISFDKSVKAFCCDKMTIVEVLPLRKSEMKN